MQLNHYNAVNQHHGLITLCKHNLHVSLLSSQPKTQNVQTEEGASSDLSEPSVAKKLSSSQAENQKHLSGVGGAD